MNPGRVSTWIACAKIVFLSVDSIKVFSDHSNNSEFLIFAGSCMVLILFSRWSAQYFSPFSSAFNQSFY